MYRTAITLCVTFTVVANAVSIIHAQENETPAEGNAKSQTQTPWVTSITKLGNSSTYAAGTGDGLLLREATVYRFEASKPNEMTPIYAHPAAVWQVVSNRDASRIASVDYRGNLGIYDTGNQPVAAQGSPWQPGPEAKLTVHEKAFERWCQAMIMTPDDKFLIAGNEAGKILVWDLAAGKVSKTAELDGHAVTGLALSPTDASQLAVSDGAGHIHLFSWPALEPQGKIKVSEETLWCVAYAEPEKLLAGSSDRNLYQAEPKAESKAESVGKGSDWITEIAISPSGRIAVAEVGGNVHFPQTISKGENAAPTYVLGDDSMKATSGVWALYWTLASQGEDQVFVGTRKNGVLVAGRSWKWAKTASDETPDPKTTQEPAEKSDEEMKKEEGKPKAKAEKPEEKKPEPAKPEPAKPEPAEKKE